jgi:molybdate transport system ATP-binding protein
VIQLSAVGAERAGFVLHDVTLEIPAGAYLVLLGPSGAGKTTLLEAIAGLLPAHGHIVIDGRVVSTEPPERRRIGLVSQDALLFPHLTVAQNVGFGLSRAHRDTAVAEAARLAGCAHLLGRVPAGLSGGERQRVAIARAIARRPAALLLDEPLGALDAPVRRELRGELRALTRRLAAGVIHVTHDLTEALELADLLGVLDQGRLVQLGPPAEVFQRPVSPAVSALLGTENMVRGEIRALGPMDQAPFAASLRAGTVELRGFASREGPGYAAIRAEDITLSIEPAHTSAQNQLTGVVRALAPAGPVVRVTIDVGIPLVVLLTSASAEAMGLTTGTRVHAQLKATAVRMF